MLQTIIIWLSSMCTSSLHLKSSILELHNYSSFPQATLQQNICVLSSAYSQLEGDRRDQEEQRPTITLKKRDPSQIENEITPRPISMKKTEKQGLKRMYYELRSF